MASRSVRQRKGKGGNGGAANTSGPLLVKRPKTITLYSETYNNPVVYLDFNKAQAEAFARLRHMGKKSTIIVEQHWSVIPAEDA